MTKSKLYTTYNSKSHAVKYAKSMVISWK